ncbi:hypothetical protein [Devosia sp. 2618]|uniref:hypothetical protein n=1 Tax=Devosia sp. 2618 TaxID=3156454 RepID=UPI00339832A7
MENLESWLLEQSGGIGTYIEFQRKCSELQRTDDQHSALYVLLNAAAARFVSFYDGMPLPVDLAQASITVLRQLVASGQSALAGSDADQLAFLNQLALVDLTAAPVQQ